MVSAAAPLVFRGMRRRCWSDYLSPKPRPTQVGIGGDAGVARRVRPLHLWHGYSKTSSCRLTLEGRATVLDRKRSFGVRGGSFREQLPRRMGESPVRGECKRPAGG